MKAIDQQFFQLFIEKISSGIAIIDEEFRYLVVNQVLADFHAVEVNQIIGRTLDEVVPDMADKIKGYMNQVFSGGVDSLNLNISGKMPNSQEERFWKVDYKLLVVPSGKRCIVVISEEITDSIKQEQRLKNSKEYLRNVLDNLFAFVGVLEPDGTLTDANKAPLEAAGIQFQDVFNKKFWDCYWWSYDEKVQQQLKQAIERAAKGEIIRYDVVVRVANEGRLPIDFMLAPLLDKYGNIINIIPSGIDISERIAANELLQRKNEQLSELLQEKITLLNEVHHRVKNNFQVISSLLNLQSQFLAPVMGEHFRMCQQRVRAMALVHQLLYESENLASVDLKAYINKLVGLLSKGLVMDSSSWSVVYTFPDAELYLEIRKMIPIGFIITELITNSMKHGVLNGKGQTMNVFVACEHNNLVVGVCDDGPGFTEETFFSSESLGNKLVKMFAKQLDAQISVSSQKPTTVSVTIPSVLFENV